MSELISSLASQTGIDPEMARKGLGAVLNFLKAQIGPEHFEKLQTSIPEASGMMSDAQSDRSTISHGFLGTISGMASKLFGGDGGSGAHLLSKLSALGLSPEQIQSFLPRAFDLLKNYLPAEILDRVKSALPALATTAAAGGE
jgi:hypothetical protein